MTLRSDWSCGINVTSGLLLPIALIRNGTNMGWNGRRAKLNFKTIYIGFNDNIRNGTNIGWNGRVTELDSLREGLSSVLVILYLKNQLLLIVLDSVNRLDSYQISLLLYILKRKFLTLRTCTCNCKDSHSNHLSIAASSSEDKVSPNTYLKWK